MLLVGRVGYRITPHPFWQYRSCKYSLAYSCVENQSDFPTLRQHAHVLIYVEGVANRNESGVHHSNVHVHT